MFKFKFLSSFVGLWNEIWLARSKKNDSLLF